MLPPRLSHGQLRAQAPRPRLGGNGEYQVWLYSRVVCCLLGVERKGGRGGRVLEGVAAAAGQRDVEAERFAAAGGQVAVAGLRAGSRIADYVNARDAAQGAAVEL